MTDLHSPTAAEWDAHLADTYTDPAEWEDRPECGHTDGWCGGVLGSACTRVTTPNREYDTPHPDGEGAWEDRYGRR